MSIPYACNSDGYVNSSGLNLLFHTGGKPILFSGFAAPFVSLFRFNELLPIATFSVIVQAVTTLGYFWLFSYKLDSIKAAILAALITTSPYIFSLHTQFMPEILWHTRPAESIVLISPALMVYFFYLYQKGKIDISNLFFNGVLCLTSVLGCLFVNWLGWHAGIGFAIIAVSSLAFIKSPMLFNRYVDKNRMTLSLNDNHTRDYSSGLQNFFLPFSFILNVWLTFICSRYIPLELRQFIWKGC